jgi:hypothetical protein
VAIYKIEIQLTTVEAYDPRVVEIAVLRGLATKEFGIVGHASVVAKQEQTSATGAGPTGQAMVRP